jgi:hypothetical protein
MVTVIKMILFKFFYGRTIARDKENFTGSVGPQGAVKQVTGIVNVFELFFSGEFVAKIVEETNRYAEQFLRGICCAASHLLVHGNL